MGFLIPYQNISPYTCIVDKPLPLLQNLFQSVRGNPEKQRAPDPKINPVRTMKQ